MGTLDNSTYFLSRPIRRGKIFHSWLKKDLLVEKKDPAPERQAGGDESAFNF